VEGAPFDHMMSVLCILHIPDRVKLWNALAKALKPGGSIYVEDYFAAEQLTDQDKAQLAGSVIRRLISLTSIPTFEFHFVVHVVLNGPPPSLRARKLESPSLPVHNAFLLSSFLQVPSFSKLNLPSARSTFLCFQM
jgi:SAM-dependent methyltransferase